LQAAASFAFVFHSAFDYLIVEMRNLQHRGFGSLSIIVRLWIARSSAAIAWLFCNLRFSSEFEQSNFVVLPIAEGDVEPLFLLTEHRFPRVAPVEARFGMLGRASSGEAVAHINP
jgi:hypothetical protein